MVVVLPMWVATHMVVVLPMWVQKSLPNNLYGNNRSVGGFELRNLWCVKKAIATTLQEAIDYYYKVEVIYMLSGVGALRP